MDKVIHPARSLRGALRVPSDRSITVRATLLGALADGVSRVRDPLDSDDTNAALACMGALGVSVAPLSTMCDPLGLRIPGVGLRGLRAPREALHCGSSGATMRLLAGLLSGQRFDSTLDGSDQLRKRPMRRVTDPLRAMGAEIDDVDGRAPLTIGGTSGLAGARYDMPVASAQVKSAVLLAGLFADGPTTVIEASATRDHTERALALFGAAVTRQGVEVTVRPSPLRSPPEAVIPGDLSSGAFFVVAAAAGQGSELTVGGVGLNPTRAGFLAVLRAMGADIAEQGQGPPGEQLGNLLVRSAPLRGVTVAAPQVPGLIDELPALMVAATQAQGRTRFEGVGELRVKETDRIASMVDGLRRLGARIQAEGPETIVVDGPCRLTGAAVEAAGDHRTAMSLAVAGLLAHGETRIRGAECVAKSFPDFFDRLAATTGSPTVITVDKP